MAYLRNKEGVSLLEIILACALVAIGMLSLARAFGSGVVASASVSYMNTALYLAQEKMEEIKNLPYDDIKSSVEWGDPVPDFPNYWRGVSVSSPVDQPDLKHVAVVVFWVGLEPGAPEPERVYPLMEIDTLIADY